MSGSGLPAISPQVWLAIALTIGAIAPARYVWRHVTHSGTPRDITQPPEDLSWKSPSLLYRNAAILALLIAFGIVIFTPQAHAFAKSNWFLPGLFAAFGTYAAGTLVPGWRDGKIQPLVRGVYTAFERDTQPKRYWASLAWNALLGIGFLVSSVAMTGDNFTPRCDDPDTDDVVTLGKALAACDASARKPGRDTAERADTFAARGRIEQRLGSYPEAIRAYSSALALDPRDSYSLYNRGWLLLSEGKFDAAIADFDASLALRPDNADAYRDRGYAHLNLHHDALADRDFAALGSREPLPPYLLAQRADFAIERGDYDLAVTLASDALERDSKNTHALRLRGEAYWKQGKEALSQADDDRVRAIEGHASQ